jgi:hypothetical protein
MDGTRIVNRIEQLVARQLFQILIVHGRADARQPTISCKIIV